MLNFDRIIADIILLRSSLLYPCRCLIRPRKTSTRLARHDGTSSKLAEPANHEVFKLLNPDESRPIWWHHPFLTQGLSPSWDPKTLQESYRTTSLHSNSNRSWPHALYRCNSSRIVILLLFLPVLQNGKATKHFRYGLRKLKYRLYTFAFAAP